MIGDILQPTHLLFILVVALLVLGPKRLPEVGRSLGRGLRDFRDAMSGEDRSYEVPSQTSTETPPPPATTDPIPEFVPPVSVATAVEPSDEGDAEPIEATAESDAPSSDESEAPASASVE